MYKSQRSLLCNALHFSLTSGAKYFPEHIVFKYCTSLCRPVSWEPGYLSRYSDKATGWTAGVRFSGGRGDFNLLRSVQTCFGAHLTSCAIGIEGCVPWDKAERMRADQSPQFNVYIKMMGLCPISHMCLIGMVIIHIIQCRATFTLQTYFIFFSK
jgi:hypothetical protein